MTLIIFFFLSVYVFHPYIAYLGPFCYGTNKLYVCFSLISSHLCIICHFCGIGINLEPIQELFFFYPCIKSSDLWVNLQISLNP